MTVKDIKGSFRAFELTTNIWIVAACQDDEPTEWPTLCVFRGEGAKGAAELMVEALTRQLRTI